MAAQDCKFVGWVGLDKDAAGGHMVWQEFEPKPWEETDVDIQVTHSGICGTDIHTLRNGWAVTSYPICVGHEIVGTVVRVGSEAEGSIRVGDRVGVGAQNDSCLGRRGDCAECASGSENYCPKLVGTYGSTHFNGGKSMGGYALYHRAPSHFVVKIPDGLKSEHAAPMLCAGASLWSPLKFHRCGPGKTVGIIGVGGLGHFGVLFAKVLGADRVVGISRSSGKRDEVLKMGADEYIATNDDKDWAKTHDRRFDIIMSTVSTCKVPLQDYLGLLKLDGALVQLGVPDDGLFSLHAWLLVARRIKFTGSVIASPKEIREMLAFAADKGIKPWVQVRPMSDANQAIVDMEVGKARYRYVLTN